MKSPIALLVCCCVCWSAAAQSAKKKPLSLHGTASLSLGVFQQNNYAGRLPGFYWSLNGNPVLGVYGHPLPVNLLISNQQRSLNAPFSQVGVSPTLKWAKFHAGVRTLQLSPFSVGGHTFLGGAVEINPGAFRFAVLGGRFQKAREADTTSVFRLRPAYRRMGYGVKIGVGRSRNYVDLLYFKAKDDSTSIRPITRRVGNLTPDENAVLGLSSRVSLSRQLFLQIDAGASLYTRDTRSTLLTESTSEAVVERLSSRLSRVMPLHTGTSLTFAGEASLRYQIQKFQLGLSYRRVEPEYASMGAWFFQTDIQQITLNPGFNFKQGRTRLQFNVGWQNDNLLGLKPATSQRLISGVNVSINPTERFGFELQANNFQFSQENRYLDSDSLRLQQSTLFVSVSPHWMIRQGADFQTINTSLTYQKSDDYNPYTRQNLRSNFVFGQVTWQRQYNSRGLNVGLGLNGRANQSGTAADDQSVGVLANASKTLLHKKLQVQANANYNLLFRQGASPGSGIGGGLGLSYKAAKSTRLHTNAYFLSSQTPQRSYQFLTIAGGVDYTF